MGDCLWVGKPSWYVATSHPDRLSLLVVIQNLARAGGEWGDRTGFMDSSPLRGRAKKFVYTIINELLHSAWCYFAGTCPLWTGWTLLNFKVICQRSRSFFRWWTKVHKIVFIEHGKNRSCKCCFPFVDCLICSRDIRNRSLELSEIQFTVDNSWTWLHEILHADVPRQPVEPYWISRL